MRQLGLGRFRVPVIRKPLRSPLVGRLYYNYTMFLASSTAKNRENMTAASKIV